MPLQPSSHTCSSLSSPAPVPPMHCASISVRSSFFQVFSHFHTHVFFAKIDLFCESMSLLRKYVSFVLISLASLAGHLWHTGHTWGPSPCPPPSPSSRAIARSCRKPALRAGGKKNVQLEAQLPKKNKKQLGAQLSTWKLRSELK